MQEKLEKAQTLEKEIKILFTGSIKEAWSFEANIFMGIEPKSKMNKTIFINLFACN